LAEAKKYEESDNLKDVISKSINKTKNLLKKLE
jgi:hypothetical protein